MDPAVTLLNKDNEKIGDVSDLSFNLPSSTGEFADDLSLTLGNLSFTTTTREHIEELMGSEIALAGIEFISNATSQQNEIRVSNLDIGHGQTAVTGIFGAAGDNEILAMNAEYNFAYAKVLYNWPNPGKLVLYDTQDNDIASFIVSDGFVEVLPLNTVLGASSGNGLTAIAQIAHSTGTIFVAGGYALPQFVDFPTELASVPNYSDLSPTVSEGQPLKEVQVVMHEGGFQENVEVFPVDGEEPQILQIDANETQVFDLTTNSWIVSLNQPDVVDWVEADPHYYDGTDGVYAVAGYDNRPITAAQWTAQGGLLRVERHPEDSKTIRVTVRGASGTTYAPYRIAMTSGNYYSALRVTGDAVLGNPRTLTFPTGADPALTRSSLPLVIDYDCVQTKEQAYLVGMSVARAHTGLLFSLSGEDASGVQVNDLLETRNRRYRVKSIAGANTDVRSFSADPVDRMGYFEEKWDGATMGDFETQWNYDHSTPWETPDKGMRAFMLQYLRRDI